MSGRNSVVECYLAKVDVDGSNPFARSNYFFRGGIAKWLRQRSAKPLYTGSSPVAASILCFKPTVITSPTTLKNTFA